MPELMMLLYLCAGIFLKTAWDRADFQFGKKKKTEPIAQSEEPKVTMAKTAADMKDSDPVWIEIGWTWGSFKQLQHRSMLQDRTVLESYSLMVRLYFTLHEACIENGKRVFIVEDAVRVGGTGVTGTSIIELDINKPDSLST